MFEVDFDVSTDTRTIDQSGRTEAFSTGTQLATGAFGSTSAAIVGISLGIDA
jgi:hypothetical protein